MNPVGTKEQREELWRERKRWFGDYPPLNALSGEQKEVLRQQNMALPIALDGLGIAEEQHLMLGDYVSLLAAQQCAGRDCTACVKAREIYELRRRWQAWKEEP